MTQVPGATVFAVDDDKSFLTAIGRVLRLGGYTVETVQSATSFLERLPRHVLGCVIVDLQMPDMTGLEFQERLRAAGWSQPVLFLSGQGTIPATTQALKGGALDFLTKPVRSEDLLKAVGEAVDRHGAILSTAGELAALRARYECLPPGNGRSVSAWRAAN